MKKGFAGFALDAGLREVLLAQREALRRAQPGEYAWIAGCPAPVGLSPSVGAPWP